MISQICNLLTDKMRVKMPEINDERAEIINYGLQLIIGEVPKIIILFLLAIILKIGWYVIFAYMTMLPYKIMAGGFHLKTHIGCTISTLIVYYGNVLISKIISLQFNIKILITLIIWGFTIIMISLYAPADTVNLPILRKKERRLKKLLSYIFSTLTLIIALIIKDNILSNILIINVLIESFCISELAYKMTKNKYGYVEYKKQEKLS